MYNFRLATKDEEKAAWKTMGGGEWIYGAGTAADGERAYALFLGKCIALFGMPENLSEDWENMYDYFITAEDENGVVLTFNIYHGSGGPSYTEYKGDSDRFDEIFREFMALIDKTVPADYVHESVYYDIPANVKYTVKDGKAYVETEIDEDLM